MASIGELNFPENGFEAVIFDCDGTLVDSMPWHFRAWCEALETFGTRHMFQEDVFLSMGVRPTTDIVVELNGEFGLQLDAEAVAFEKRRVFMRCLERIEPIDEVVGFARKWRGRVPLGVASGGQRMVVEKTLQAAGLSDLFDEVVAAEDVSAGKPAPDLFMEAASRLGVKPENCLVLEDAPAGITAAQLAGMKVLTVPSPLGCTRA
jgi:beta-phosphoglucomutase-like phosphatase (HAD superfamily)